MHKWLRFLLLVGALQWTGCCLDEEHDIVRDTILDSLNNAGGNNMEKERLEADKIDKANLTKK